MNGVTTGTRCARILLLALGIMAVLSLGLAARSTWSYSLVEGASSNTLTLVGLFDVSSMWPSGGRASSLSAVISNPTDSLLTVLWDESAVILPGGESARVIHTGVRIIDKAAPQAPTAIAPHSRTTEAIWPVSHVTAREYFSTASIRLWNNCRISLYLTIQDASGKRTDNWTWVFTRTVVPEPPQTSATPEAPRKPINWWFWGSLFLVLVILGSLVQAGVLPD